jgi:hypothetical protein
LRARSIILAISVSTGLTPLCSCQNLRLEILRGAAAYNNAASTSAVTPSVRVTDAAGKPVSGALVIFTAPSSGPSLDFAGDGPLAHTETDESGSAVAPHSRPVGGNGPVEIEVVAEKGGDSVHASLVQINLGLDSGQAAPEDLNVTLIGIVSPRQKADRTHVNLRIAARDDEAVADAEVECTLRAVKASGEFEELFRTKARSNAEGQTVCELSRKAGPNSELVVRATMAGQSATRYFKLNSR